MDTIGNQLLGAGKEIGSLNASVRELKAENERLREENNELIKANHSVSVCKDHTQEITSFDGCLVCVQIKLRKAISDVVNGDIELIDPEIIAALKAALEK